MIRMVTAKSASVQNRYAVALHSADTHSKGDAGDGTGEIGRDKANQGGEKVLHGLVA